MRGDVRRWLGGSSTLFCLVSTFPAVPEIVHTFALLVTRLIQLRTALPSSTKAVKRSVPPIRQPNKVVEARFQSWLSVKRHGNIQVGPSSLLSSSRVSSSRVSSSLISSSRISCSLISWKRVASRCALFWKIIQWSMSGTKNHDTFSLLSLVCPSCVVTFSA